MAETWRLIDTGLRTAAQNIALSRALLEARHGDEIPTTLRFLRYAPCALLAYQHSAAQELHVNHCASRNIAIQRRITGGAAVYLDENAIGWELYLHRRDVGKTDIRALSQRVCHAAAAGIGALGAPVRDARYRAPNEIEVDGRGLASCAVGFDGDAWLVQGALHVNHDLQRMLSVLRLPFTGSMDAALAAAGERYTDLKRLLPRVPDARVIKHNLTEAFESEFDVEFREADLTLSEEARYDAALREVDSRDWIDLASRSVEDVPILEASETFSGGVLRAALTYEKSTQRLRQIWFTADVAIKPSRALPDLEAALRDVRIDTVIQKVESFFTRNPADLGSLKPADFAAVVRRALQQPLLAQGS